MNQTTQPPVSGAGSLPVLTLAAAAFSIAQTAVVPGMGMLSHALNASTTDVSWVMSGYLLAAAVLTPVLGRLGDMYGKRRMLIVVLAVFAVGSVVAALAPNVWVLVAARVLQGAGGGIIPLCLGLVGDWFEPQRRPVALGVISAIAGIGAGVGLLMGGLLLDHASWHWIFWSGAAMAAAAALGALRLPADEGGARARLDYLGVVLLAVGLVAPLFALTRTSTWGWGDERTLGLILFGLLVLTVFVFVERRTTDPLVDMRVLGRPAVLGTNITTLLFGFGMFGAFMLIPQLAQTPTSVGYGFGMNATGAGLLLLPACFMMLVAGGASGRLSARFGPKIPLTGGAVVAAFGLVALAMEHGTRLGVIAWSMVIFGGIGLGMAAVPNLVMESVPREMIGQGNGVNNLIRSVGSSLGSQIVATLLAGSVSASLRVPSDHAYSQAFWIGAAGVSVAAVAAALIPRRRGPVEPVDVAPASAPRAVAVSPGAPH
ncbi:MFS transporter [Nocardia bovistercoris]|uniref:MFS transporter n=1 Tax=Nocardia bovistercoris TaxID=2785916 RepID=A0A931ID68_9NOCA|nr:MFS transporter [Nocardia bovistercoris]MBH0779502.1 MFS transporter [Nocardia bovistercoris]